MPRAQTPTLFLAIIALLSARLAPAGDPPAPPCFDLGSLTAVPGQADGLLPLAISFTDAHLTGWSAVVRADPAAAPVQFNPPDAFVDPGAVGVAVIYTFDGGEDAMPAASGTVGHREFSFGVLVGHSTAAGRRRLRPCSPRAARIAARFHANSEETHSLARLSR